MHKRFFPALLVLMAAARWVCAGDAGTVETVAGTGKADDGGSGGPALETNVGMPFGVEIGPDGALYITEVSNHRVRRLDRKTGQLTTVAGCGERGYSGDGGPATEARLNEPYEVRFDKHGNMYFVEMMNNLIRRVDAETRIISTVAGRPKMGFRGDSGKAADALFQHPHSIALDEKGFLYVADIGNRRIRRINLVKGTIETIAGTGARVMPKDGTHARGNPMMEARALAIDGRTLWIALRSGHSVWKLDLETGIVHHVAGGGKMGYSGDGGPPEQATFNGPKGIAVGPQKNVFVVDTENQVIRRINPNKGTIDTVAGMGPHAKGPGGDGGPATQVEMNRPHGICIAPDGSIYIGDSVNHRVRRIVP